MKEISKIDIDHLETIREHVSLLTQQASELDRKGLKILDIAPQDHAGAKAFFKEADVMTLDIDPNSGADYIADITNTNSSLIPDSFFDAIICTEVLEHTLNPFSAVNELHRILKKDGKLFISTPFNFRIHGPLPDCWRFTVHGLKQLLKEFSSVKITEIETKNRFLMPIQYKTRATK